jgi:hypothetical protein
LRNKILIPRVPYIVFQLARVDVNKYLNDESYRAEEVETIYLAIKPEQIEYTKSSRDAITQTTDKVFVHKFPLAPERCRISGTFGYRPALIAGTYMDGYTRLKQFEEDLFEQSKALEFPNDTDRYFYVVNYYDFLYQKFGAINFDSYKVRVNARDNSQLQLYSCEYILTGELINVLSRDPLLELLTKIFGEDGVLSGITEIVNGVFELAEPYLSLAGTAQEAMKTSLTLSRSADSYISGYSAGSKIYSSVAKLF